MKHKTLTRLMIKVVGIMMIASGLPHAIGFLFQAGFTAALDYYGSGGADLLYALTWMSGYVLGGFGQVALGLYLFFGGKAIVNLCIPSNRPYCPECGYDLTQSRSERCPECGVALPRSITPPPVIEHSSQGASAADRPPTPGEPGR